MLISVIWKKKKNPNNLSWVFHFSNMKVHEFVLRICLMSRFFQCLHVFSRVMIYFDGDGAICFPSKFWWQVKFWWSVPHKLQVLTNFAARANFDSWYLKFNPLFIQIPVQDSILIMTYIQYERQFCCCPCKFIVFVVVSCVVAAIKLAWTFWLCFRSWRTPTSVILMFSRCTMSSMGGSLLFGDDTCVWCADWLDTTPCADQFWQEH